MGCETALFVAEALKKRVRIVEMLDDILVDYAEPITQMALRIRLQEAGVEIKTGLTFRSYSGKKVVCVNKSGHDEQMDADSLILATGLRPRENEVQRLEDLAPQVFKVGDCVKTGKIYDAFRSAWRAVLYI